jgi:hypothetical protein
MAARQALNEYLLVFKLNKFLLSSALYKLSRRKWLKKYPNIIAAKLFMAAWQALNGYFLVFMLNIFLSNSAFYKSKQKKMIEKVPKYYGC